MAALVDDSIVIVLAGGAGERLFPLTRDRAKPAVYFGGPYRIIDFALSNCINSGLRRIFIATQYKSLSLNRHIRMGWGIVSEELGEFVEILPPQKRVSEHWYQGTADAVYQNLYSIMREGPRHLIVLSGDPVYKMDYARMLRFHQEHAAGVTLATIEVPIADAHRFGVVAIDERERVTEFQEKVAQPTPIPGSSDLALASMGVYIFDPDVLVRALEADATQATNHDFGKDIIPTLIHGRSQRAVLRRTSVEVLATSGRSTRIRSQHGSVPRQSGIQSVRPGMAAADLPAAGAAGEVRVCRDRTAMRTGARLGHLAGLHRLGVEHLRQRAVPQRARAQLLEHRAVHPDARRARGPARAHPPRHHRPRRADSARRAHRVQPRRGPAAPHGDRRGRRCRDDRR